MLQGFDDAGRGVTLAAEHAVEREPLEEREGEGRCDVEDRPTLHGVAEEREEDLVDRRAEPFEQGQNALAQHALATRGHDELEHRREGRARELRPEQVDRTFEPIHLGRQRLEGVEERGAPLCEQVLDGMGHELLLRGVVVQLGAPGKARAAGDGARGGVGVAEIGQALDRCLEQQGARRSAPLGLGAAPSGAPRAPAARPLAGSGAPLVRLFMSLPHLSFPPAADL